MLGSFIKTTLKSSNCNLRLNSFATYSVSPLAKIYILLDLFIVFIILISVVKDICSITLCASIKDLFIISPIFCISSFSSFTVNLYLSSLNPFKPHFLIALETVAGDEYVS